MTEHDSPESPGDDAGASTSSVRQGPPRWWRISVAVLSVAVALIALVVLASEVAYVGVVPGLLVGVYGLGLTGLAWLVLLIIGSVRYRAWKPLITPAAIVVVLFGLIYLSIPQQLQHAASTSALNDAADNCPISDSPVWVGAYRFNKVEQIDGVCFFYEDGFIDQWGIVRLPDGPPADAYERWNVTLAHYSDDWYAFRWHF